MQAQAAPVRVPTELAGDVEQIVKLIKDAAERDGKVEADAVKIVRPQTKGMVFGGAEVVFLLAGSGVTWFTKKWFETCVWPELEKRMRAPTKEALDFLFNSLGWDDPDPAKP